jgi:AraC-like DNA-binding protein
MTGRFEPELSKRAIGALPMPAAYFNLVLRRYGTDRAASLRLLRGTGIGVADAESLSPEGTIRLWQQLQQVRNLCAVGPADWGLETGRALGNAAHGNLGVATASAPTLAQALSTLERFAYLRAPFFRLASETQSSWFWLRVEPQLELEPAAWHGLVESLLMSLQAMIESALGTPMARGRFELSYAAPRHAARYAELFHAPVCFVRPATAVAIPQGWLPLRCPFADAGLHRAALERLEGEERSLQSPQLIVAQVERILEGACDGPPALGEVARQLHLSRRTLVRRLGANGASFRDVTDQLRKRRATALLADPQLSVTEVAYRLGYTDLANFGHAFRRWFGTSPRGHRARSQALRGKPRARRAANSRRSRPTPQR